MYGFIGWQFDEGCLSDVMRGCVADNLGIFFFTSSCKNNMFVICDY